MINKEQMIKDQVATLELQGYVLGDDGIWMGKCFRARQTDCPGATCKDLRDMGMPVIGPDDEYRCLVIEYFK